MKLTEKQLEIVAKNIQAFTANFGEIRIERSYYNSFFVYYPSDSNDNEWIYAAENIHNLNGWLYGCVQGVLRVQHIYKNSIEGSVNR